MEKLSFITAEAITVKRGTTEYPCVVLFGRDSKGIKRRWRTKYYPYGYIHESDYTKLIDEGFKIEGYVREAVGTFKRGLTKKTLTKLYMKDLRSAGLLRTVLHKRQLKGLKDPMYTYEFDLATLTLLPLRYMIDKGITSGFSIDKDNKLTAVDVPSNLRKWYIDFEAYSKKMCGHGPKKNEAINMVTVWDNYDNILYTLYVSNPNWKSRVILNPLGDYHIVKGFKTEANMLDYLVELMIKLDPDLLSAWNLDRYDIVQWKYRMDALRKQCVYNFKDISPLKSISFNHKPYRIKGRILFDLMKGFKKFTQAELRSYSLGTIAEIEKIDEIIIDGDTIKIEKIPFKGTPANTWDKYPQVIFKRNVFDVLILKALDDKYEIVEMFNDLRIEFGALFHEVLMNYRVLDTALLRFINRGTVLMTSTKGRSSDKFLGAVVVDPITGAYVYIAQFDFTREYPNIMKMFNISPETYRRPDYRGDCYTIKYRDLVFKFIKKPIGLLPRLIDYFFKKRDEYEKEYSKAIAKGNKAKIKMWWRRIFNIKTMTNAIYGVMDFPSFRLNRRECSAAVAVIGRLSIERLQKIALRLGYELIYGDTDSIFVKLKGKNKKKVLQEGKRLARQLNEGLSKYFIKTFGVLKAPSELGLKKIYSRYLLLGRKNYGGKSVWDEKKGWKEEYDFKGFEPIRSDSSNLEKEVLEKLTKIFLDGKPTKETHEYSESIMGANFSEVYEPIDVAYPLALKKPWRVYLQKNKNGGDKTPSHARAALYSNKFLNTDFENGDKPRRLPIIPPPKSKKKIGRKDEGQSTLFNEVSYPLIWKYKDNEWPLKDISIGEDMEIPNWFIQKIDWERIRSRLENKINKILNLLEGFNE